MKEEIERIINLFSSVDDIEIENDIEEIQNAGFINQEDYLYIKNLKDRCDNFIQNAPQWEGLGERIPKIQKSIIYIHLLRDRIIDA